MRRTAPCWSPALPATSSGWRPTIPTRCCSRPWCGTAGGRSPTGIPRALADYPLREGLWLLLMRALDGAGRHAEALEVYGRARDAISGQLGVDPGAELRQLYAELLAKDSAAPAGTISAGTVPAGAVSAGTVLTPGGTTPPGI